MLANEAVVNMKKWINDLFDNVMYRSLVTKIIYTPYIQRISVDVSVKKYNAINCVLNGIFSMRLFDMHDFSGVYVFKVKPGYMLLELETNLDTLKCFGIVHRKDIFFTTRLSIGCS